MSIPDALDLSSSAVLESASVEGRRRRARSLAVFFAAGGTVSLLVLLATTFGDLPAWADADRAGVAVTVALAATAAVVLAVAAERIGAVACHLFAAAGSVLIATCQAFAGGGIATTGYALLYVFVVLHAALFFTTRAVVGQVLVSAAAQVVALIWVGEATAIAPQLILTAGTQLVSGLVISALAVNLRVRADTDPLTGLGNRRRAYTRLVRELELDHPLADVSCSAGLAAWDGREAAGELILRAYHALDRAKEADDAVVVATGTGSRGADLHAPA